MAKIYLGDVGTVFRLETGTDLTLATDQSMKVLKPDEVEEVWAAEIEDPASAGVLTYTVVDGDLDTVGKWKIQAYVEFGTDHWLGETRDFTVYDEYK